MRVSEMGLAMSDRELSMQLQERLALALNAGTRLRAPLPSQARYARTGLQMGAGATAGARVFALAGVVALYLS